MHAFEAIAYANHLYDNFFTAFIFSDYSPNRMSSSLTPVRKEKTSISIMLFFNDSTFSPLFYAENLPKCQNIGNLTGLGIPKGYSSVKMTVPH